MNYGYDLDNAALWYRKEYRRALEECKDCEGEEDEDEEDVDAGHRGEHRLEEEGDQQPNAD